MRSVAGQARFARQLSPVSGPAAAAELSDLDCLGGKIGSRLQSVSLYLRYSTDRQRKSKLQRSLSAKGQHLKLFKGLKSVGQDTGEKEGVKRRYYITLFGDSL